MLRSTTKGLCSFTIQLYFPKLNKKIRNSLNEKEALFALRFSVLGNGQELVRNCQVVSVIDKPGGSKDHSAIKSCFFSKYELS